MKQNKAWLAGLLALALALAGLPVAVAAPAPEQPFKDVAATHWASDAIRLAVERGYVSGFPNGTFKPDEKVSRAQFFRMLADGLKLPHTLQGEPWYQPYVAALIETGIRKEQDFKDKYDDDLSRLEMVKLAVRAVTPGIDNDPNAADDNWLVYRGTELGILAGIGAGKLALDGTSTRAQAVAVIERILAVNAGKKLAVDKYAMANAELAWHSTNIFTVMPQFFNDPVNETNPYAEVGIRSWDVGKLRLQNKNFSGELTELIAIDLADKNDPNRYLLPAMDKMKWGYNEYLPVPDDAYVLFVKYKINYNHAPETYLDVLGLEIRGFDYPENYRTKLLTPTNVGVIDDKNYDADGKRLFAFPRSGYKFTNDERIVINLQVEGLAGGSHDSYIYSEIVRSWVRGV